MISLSNCGLCSQLKFRYISSKLCDASTAPPILFGGTPGHGTDRSYDLGLPPVSFWGFVRLCISYLTEAQRRAQYRGGSAFVS